MLGKFIMCEDNTVINTNSIQTFYIEYSTFEHKHYLYALLLSGYSVKIKEVPEMTHEEQKNFLFKFISSVYER